jgi:hypothetical protein
LIQLLEISRIDKCILALSQGYATVWRKLRQPSKSNTCEAQP